MDPNVTKTLLIRDDVLITRLDNTRYELSRFPDPPTAICKSLQTALDRASVIAETERVDIWSTSNRRSFLREGRYRLR